MDSSQIDVWDYAFSSPLLTKKIPKKTYNLVLKDKFNGESDIYACIHSFIFMRNYVSCKITNRSLICMLFACTFTSRIWKWFETFAISSIHS